MGWPQDGRKRPVCGRPRPAMPPPHHHPTPACSPSPLAWNCPTKCGFTSDFNYEPVRAPRARPRHAAARTQPRHAAGARAGGRPRAAMGRGARAWRAPPPPAAPHQLARLPPTAARAQVIYNPATREWSKKGSLSWAMRPRLYHSTTLLTPDCTVMTSGEGWRRLAGLGRELCCCDGMRTRSPPAPPRTSPGLAPPTSPSSSVCRL